MAKDKSTWSVSGARLKRLFNENKRKIAMTQKDLAERLHVHPSLVNKWIKGEREVSIETIGEFLYVLKQAEWIKTAEEAFELVWGWYDAGELIETLEKAGEHAGLIAWLEKGQPQWRISVEKQNIRLPDHYVEREELNTWCGRLTGESSEGTSAVKRMAMWGMGGIGKTTMATALALDPRVQSYFRNGVLWAELGPNELVARAQVRRYLRDWCSLLDLGWEAGESDELLSGRLREKLNDAATRVLIILDDVWWTSGLDLLLVDGPQSRVVITARDRNVASKLAWDGPQQIIELGVMNEVEAIELVRNRMKDHWQAEMEDYAGELARLVEGLPLALELGAALVNKQGWAWVLELLRVEMGAVDTLRLPREERRQHSLRWTLDVSHNLLEIESRLLFEMVGMFAPGVAFAVQDVEFGWPVQWMKRQKLNQKYLVRDGLVYLTEVALVQEVEKGQWYRLHPLVAQYAAEKLEVVKGPESFWDQFITSQKDQLFEMTRLLPLRAQVRIMSREWSHVEHAWRKAQQWETEAEHRWDWARAFGEMGCQVLWRKHDWENVVRWAREAKTLCRRSGLELDGEADELVGDPLDLWEIDGLLKLGQVGGAWRLVRRGLKNERVQAKMVWLCRYQIRHARCYLMKGCSDKSWGVINDVLFQTENLLFEGEGGRVALAELHWLLGDWQARWGTFEQAEDAWKETVEHFIISIKHGSEYGPDWWWVEQVVEQVVRRRAKYELWREAAVVGEVWIRLREILDLPLEEPLIQVAIWSLRAGYPNRAEKAVMVLQDRLAAGDKALAAIVPELRGMGLALAGQGQTAITELTRALRAGKHVPFATSRTYVQAVLKALRADQQWPEWPGERAMSAYDESEDTGFGISEEFEQWLEDVVEQLLSRERPLV